VSARLGPHGRDRLLCRQHIPARPVAQVPKSPVTARQCRRSGRLWTAQVRENARGVCVARWYDPGTGEFMSVDPDLAETDQPYAYAGDDPVNEGDPSGLHKCNLDPLSWGGCVENAVDTAAQNAFRSLVQPAVDEALTNANRYEGSGSENGIATCDALTSASEPSPDHTWERWPDWIGIDVNGTFLAPLALIYPELLPLVSHLDLGYQITIDRYGNVYFGYEGGVTLTVGEALAADAGWIFNSNVPSEPDLKSFISSWSITAGAQWGFGPGAGAYLVYGDVGGWGWHAFGVQYEFGAINGKGVSLLDSYTRYLFNIGREW
jgi:RHS repeat-associated protein